MRECSMKAAWAIRNGSSAFSQASGSTAVCDGLSRFANGLRERHDPACIDARQTRTLLAVVPARCLAMEPRIGAGLYLSQAFSRYAACRLAGPLIPAQETVKSVDTRGTLLILTIRPLTSVYD